MYKLSKLGHINTSMTLQTLSTILTNIINHPEDEKFRKISVEDQKFQKRVLEASSIAVKILEELVGFHYQDHYFILENFNIEELKIVNEQIEKIV